MPTATATAADALLARLNLTCLQWVNLPQTAKVGRLSTLQASGISSIEGIPAGIPGSLMEVQNQLAALDAHCAAAVVTAPPAPPAADSSTSPILLVLAGLTAGAIIVHLSKSDKRSNPTKRRTRRRSRR